MTTSHPSGSPIFVLGMLQRTGTNHLSDLFALHPDVDPFEPIFEDHLLRWSSHLTSYVDDVTRCWTPDWKVPPDEPDALLASLGSGIVDWIASHSKRRIVTKMPSVEQGDRYFDLFDGCPLIVLIRDGRNVCASGVRSFGWSYERAFRRWSAAADVVLGLQDRYGERDDFALVRYEDLIDNPRETMRRMCDVAGLDVNTYPFDAIDELPVRGSSTLRSNEGDEKIHWVPIERDGSFDPRKRYHDWDDHIFRRFNAVAGDQQRRLGYPVTATPGTSSLVERASGALDLAEVRARELRVKLGRARRAVGRVQGKI